MKRIDADEAQVHLSHYLDRVGKGETLTICRRNVPIAELRPIPAPESKLRSFGRDSGMKVPDSFFEPLPDDLLDAFEGRGEP